MLALIPLNSLGKGVGKKIDRAWLSRRKWTAGGPGTRYLPRAVVFRVIGGHIAFLKLVSRYSQGEPHRSHLWGVTGKLITHFKRKPSSSGLWGMTSVCMHTHRVICVMFLTTWQYSPLNNFFYCWKEMVKLFKQSKDVENVYCHSCHFILFAAET